MSAVKWIGTESAFISSDHFCHFKGDDPRVCVVSDTCLWCEVCCYKILCESQCGCSPNQNGQGLIAIWLMGNEDTNTLRQTFVF